MSSHMLCTSGATCSKIVAHAKASQQQRLPIAGVPSVQNTRRNRVATSQRTDVLASTTQTDNKKFFGCTQMLARNNCVAGVRNRVIVHSSAFTEESTKPTPRKQFPEDKLPEVIQGGMGAHVSNWEVAGTVAGAGQMGVVSGTAMDSVLARTLQIGDPGGHFRRAMAAFPDQKVADKILKKFYREPNDEMKGFRQIEMYTLEPSVELLRLTVVANFCEVWLAKEHAKAQNGGIETGMVGMNLLTKIEMPTLPSLYGAMLAGVDCILMGAGIPRHVPKIMDKLARHEPASMPISVENAPDGQEFRTTFDPKYLFHGCEFQSSPLTRPLFLPIVSSTVLAKSLMKTCGPEGVAGFIVELPSAGGHNAPPRGKLKLDEGGQPVYGPKDSVAMEEFAKLGMPFWAAGGYGRPGRLREAQSLGAAGVQVGTLFAFSREAGFSQAEKKRVYDEVREHELGVFTDPRASPTGFPFKVLELEGSLAEEEIYQGRPRVCNLGYLRVPYFDEKTEKVGFKCASEPVKIYEKKGGSVEDTEGRKCLCNALLANIGLGNVMRMKDGTQDVERALVTVGDDINLIRAYLPDKPEDGQDFEDGYSALDVIAHILED